MTVYFQFKDRVLSPKSFGLAQIDRSFFSDFWPSPFLTLPDIGHRNKSSGHLTQIDGVIIYLRDVEVRGIMVYRVSDFGLKSPYKQREPQSDTKRI